MERKLVRHEALQNDRDENGTRDRQARLLGRPAQPRGLMQLPARRREPFNMCGDVREALVDDARVHRAIRAHEVVVPERPGARRFRGGRARTIRRNAVARLGGGQRLRAVARVQG